MGALSSASVPAGPLLVWPLLSELLLSGLPMAVHELGTVVVSHSVGAAVVSSACTSGAMFLAGVSTGRPVKATLLSSAGPEPGGPTSLLGTTQLGALSSASVPAGPLLVWPLLSELLLSGLPMAVHELGTVV